MYVHVSPAKATEMLEKAYNDTTMRNALIGALDSLNYYHCTHLHAYDASVPASDRLEDWSDHYEMNLEINIPRLENEVTLNGKLPAAELQQAEIIGEFGD